MYVCYMQIKFSSVQFIFPLRGRLPPKTWKKAFFGYPHTPRATAQGINFRSTAIAQSVSGDARDVPLTLSFYVGRTVWELGSIKVAHFSEMTHVLQLRLSEHAAAYSSCLQTAAHMAKLYRFLRFQQRQTQQKCCWQLPEIPAAFTP